MAEGRVATPRPKVESPWMEYQTWFCHACGFWTTVQEIRDGHDGSLNHVSKTLEWQA